MASTSQGRRQSARTRPVQTPAKRAGAASTAPSATTGMDVWDKIVWYSLHALIFLVPVAMSNLTFLGIGNGAPVTYDQFDIAKVFVMRAFILVALAAWAWKMGSRGGKVRTTKVDWLILIFLGWVAITSMTSISPATAVFGKYRRFEGLLSFLTYAAVYFLVVQMVDRRERVRSLLRTLFFAGVVVAGYGLLQYIGLDPIRWGNLPFEVNRSFSTYGNPDLLGGFLVFSLIISLGLALSEDNVPWRALYWVGFLLNAVVWVTASVRGAWVGGLVGIVVVAVVVALAMRMSEYRLEAVDYGAAGLSVTAIVALVIRSLEAPNAVMNVVARIKSILEFGEGSALTRFEIWQAAVAAIKARPILGFGADTFRLVFPLYKPATYTRDAGYLSVADNVHDYPLQLASALGIIGFLLLYGVLGLVVWLAGSALSPIRGDVFGALGPVGLGLVVVVFFGLLGGLWYLRDRPKAQEFVAWAFFGVFGYVLYLSAPRVFAPSKGKERLLMVSVWAAALAYIVHLFFGLSVTGSTVLLWFCFALLLAPLATAREVKAPSWGPAVGLVVVLLSTAGFAYNMLYVSADTHYLYARVGGLSSGSAVDEVKAALALNPWNDMYRAELGLAYQSQMQGWIREAQQTAGNQQQTQQAAVQARDAFTAAERSFNDVIAFVPSEYDNYVFLANLYNQAGVYFDPAYFDKAIATAKRGIEVEPYGPAVRFQLALAYEYKGDMPNALKAAQAAEKMDPRYVELRMLAGDILRKSGDLKGSKAAYQEAYDITVQTGVTDQQPAITSALQAVDASLKAGEPSRTPAVSVAPKP